MLKNKKIVFRCDATQAIGTGHLMRCKVLASHFVKLGWSCHFICCDETFEKFSHLFDEKFTFTFDEGSIDYCDLLVIDHYQLDQSYEKECRNFAQNIMVIDDLANRKHDCDFLLDQTEGRVAKDYQHLVTQDCELLLGAKFALLRDGFINARPKALIKREDRKGSVQNVLISLGGTNLHQITEKVVEFLNGYSKHQFQLNVVMGSVENISDQMKSLEHKINNKGHHEITLLTTVTNMEEFMLNADIAIGAGGTTSWERCCLGLPTIMIELADNQHLIATKLHEAGAVYNLGWHDQLDKNEILEILDMLCGNPEHIINIQKIAFGICDGQGVSRVTSLIKEKFTHE